MVIKHLHVSDHSEHEMHLTDFYLCGLTTSFPYFTWNSSRTYQTFTRGASYKSVHNV